VIEAKDVTFAYDGGPPVVRDFNTTIWRGDKIGIIGPNGSGKDDVAQAAARPARARRGRSDSRHELEVVYLDQLRGQIDDAKTVGQNVARRRRNSDLPRAGAAPAQLPAGFSFPADRVRCARRCFPAASATGCCWRAPFPPAGERAGARRATNDLDAETLELLEALLVEYTGTLLLVPTTAPFSTRW